MIVVESTCDNSHDNMYQMHVILNVFIKIITIEYGNPTICMKLNRFVWVNILIPQEIIHHYVYVSSIQFRPTLSWTVREHIHTIVGGSYIQKLNTNKANHASAYYCDRTDRLIQFQLLLRCRPVHAVGFQSRGLESETMQIVMNDSDCIDCDYDCDNLPSKNIWIYIWIYYILILFLSFYSTATGFVNL